MSDFRNADLDLRRELDALVPPAVRERHAALPDTVEVRGRPIDIQYDVEEEPTGKVAVARLRLPEKLARTLVVEELPRLDRPLRFVVTRGARGAARAATLAALQEELERPFTPEEIAQLEAQWEARRQAHRERKRGARVRQHGRDLREHTHGGDGRAGGQGGRRHGHRSGARNGRGAGKGTSGRRRRS